MEIKGNTYYFSKTEKNKIKKLIDKKFGKISTTKDYRKIYDDYDPALVAAIHQVSEKISGSSLERLAGLTGSENKGVRKSTLEIVVRYLDFQNIEQFLKHLEYSLLHPDSSNQTFNFNSVFKNHLIEIKFGDNKVLTSRFFSVNKFEILNSSNSKIIAGDIVELSQLEVGEELICRNISRVKNRRTVILGTYNSGQNNKVSQISFVK